MHNPLAPFLIQGIVLCIEDRTLPGVIGGVLFMAGGCLKRSYTHGRFTHNIAATAVGATIGTIAVIRKIRANKAAVL